ncbi:unnamed protein product [Ophioblennius macclurei]
MFSVLVFAVLCASCLAEGGDPFYSFSEPVGTASGESFALDGAGYIDGIRVWEFPGGHIAGLQVRYDGTWTSVAGSQTDYGHELLLSDEGETIVQVSGKYNENFISQVYFVTNHGRFLVAGQPIALSFNMYPEYDGTELKLLSGRHSENGILSLGAHWGTST